MHLQARREAPRCGAEIRRRAPPRPAQRSSAIVTISPPHVRPAVVVREPRVEARDDDLRARDHPAANAGHIQWRCRKGSTSSSRYAATSPFPSLASKRPLEAVPPDLLAAVARQQVEELPARLGAPSEPRDLVEDHPYTNEQPSTYPASTRVAARNAASSASLRFQNANTASSDSVPRRFARTNFSPRGPCARRRRRGRGRGRARRGPSSRRRARSCRGSRSVRPGESRAGRSRRRRGGRGRGSSPRRRACSGDPRGASDRRRGARRRSRRSPGTRSPRPCGRARCRSRPRSWPAGRRRACP